MGLLLPFAMAASTASKVVQCTATAVDWSLAEPIELLMLVAPCS